jgi:hypothetical protein
VWVDRPTIPPNAGRYLPVSAGIEQLQTGCYTEFGMTLEELEREYTTLRQQSEAVRSYL